MKVTGPTDELALIVAAQSGLRDAAELMAAQLTRGHDDLEPSRIDAARHHATEAHALLGFFAGPRQEEPSTDHAARVRLKALEDAVKAMCPTCAEIGAPDQGPHEHKTYGSARERFMCKAAPIWMLIEREKGERT